MAGQSHRCGVCFPITLRISSTSTASTVWIAMMISRGSLGWMAGWWRCWSGGACLSRVNDGGGAAVQHPGHVAHATALQGHLEPLRCAFRPAAMVTVLDEN